MKIVIVTPAPPRSLSGNRVTALKWARILREANHRVTVCQEFNRKPCDVLVALHARKSFESIRRFHASHPDRPLLVALTGTDLYGDIHTDASARQALDWAWRLIVLQEAGVAALSADLRHKARVIPISMDGETFAFCRRLAERRPVAAAGGTFDVCVLGHLRTVKDPFRAAEAARIIPASSRVRIHHIGAALDETMRAEARRQEAGNPRYRWLGELPRRKALRILASCPLMALTSEMEGAANVVTEALAVGTPIVASRIPGLVGRLGEDYPGFFPFGDTHALAHLLHRAETEPQFYEQLCSRCADLLPLIDPVGEQRSWVTLLAEAAASRT